MQQIRGRAVHIQDRVAYLAIESFGVDYFKLLAVDHRDKKVIWQVKTRGWISNCFPVAKNRLVTIEGGWLVARNIQNGKIIWENNLRLIGSKKEVIKMLHVRPLKTKSNFWNLTFMPGPDCGFVFRQAYEAHHDLVSVGEKDWLRFDLDTGKCVDSGDHALLEIGRDYALLTDEENFFLIKHNGLSRLAAGMKRESQQNLDFDLNYDLLDQEQRCSGPIRVSSRYFSGRLLIFHPQKKQMKTVDIPYDQDYQCKSVWADRYLLVFSECLRTDSSGKKKDLPFWIEAFDLDGRRVGRIEGKWGNDWLSCEGIGMRGDAFFELSGFADGASLVRRLALPDLHVQSEYRLNDLKGIHNILIAEPGGAAVLCVADTNLFGVNSVKEFLSQKDKKHAFRFRFINLDSKQEYWTFAPEISAGEIEMRKR